MLWAVCTASGLRCFISTWPSAALLQAYKAKPRVAPRRLGNFVSCQPWSDFSDVVGNACSTSGLLRMAKLLWWVCFYRPNVHDEQGLVSIPVDVAGLRKRRHICRDERHDPLLHWQA